MSLLRRSIFVLFAGCVIFAIGVALGTGPLQGDSDGDDASAADLAAARDQSAADTQSQRFSEAVSVAVSPASLRGVLDGQSVSLVVLPGVDDDVRTDYEDVITRAGGTVAATVHVSADYLDSSNKTYVDSVANSSLRGAPDLKSLAGSDTYTLTAALVARAYTGTADDLTVDAEATRIDSELQGAKLVRLDGDVRRRGSLVVVLATDDHANSDEARAAVLIQTELVAGLARAADGVVAVAPPASTEKGGVLAALRSAQLGKRVSTVNVQDGIAARLAAMHALAAASQGKAGDYGVTGSEVALPPALVGSLS